jgi:hypothetical protein
MDGQILPNNNERCYNNFSPTFLKLNTPYIYYIISKMPAGDRNSTRVFLCPVACYNLCRIRTCSAGSNRSTIRRPISYPIVGAAGRHIHRAWRDKTICTGTCIWTWSSVYRRENAATGTVNDALRILGPLFLATCRAYATERGGCGQALPRAGKPEHARERGERGESGGPHDFN